MERIVRQRRRRHRVRELQEVRALAAVVRHRSHRLAVRDERDVVLRRDVFRDAGRYEDVLVAIEIEIGDERAPAPIRSRDFRHLADIAERTIAIVVLEHVAHQLMVIATARATLIHLPTVEGGCRLETRFVFREHVGRVDVRPAIVVEIGDVQPH